MKVEFPAVINSSMVADARACELKAARTHFQHWKPKLPSIHLHAGAAFAKGLEVARLSFYKDGNDPETAVADGVQALLAFYGDFESGGHAKSAERMAEALVFYFTEWPLGLDGKPPHRFANGKLGVEFNFAEPIEINHPVTGDPLIYCGRADMMCDFQGGLWLEDDKTATQLGQSWLNQWRIRSQFTGYVWAARQAGLTVAGVNVRGVSILKTQYGKAEGLYARQPWQVDQWYEQLLMVVANMISAWDTGKWAMNLDHACGDYGGCEYLDTCEAKEPMEWLPMQFARRRYDPLLRIETDLGDEPCPSL